MYLENVLYSITVSYHNIILMDIYRTLYGILGVSLFIIFHEMRQSKSQASDKQATSETTLTRKSQATSRKRARVGKIADGRRNQEPETVDTKRQQTPMQIMKMLMLQHHSTYIIAN